MGAAIAPTKVQYSVELFVAKSLDPKGSCVCGSFAVASLGITKSKALLSSTNIPMRYQGETIYGDHDDVYIDDLLVLVCDTGCNYTNPHAKFG